MSDYGPLFAGFDPGASGGLGLLDAAGQFAAAYPWPETERDTADLIAEYAPHIRIAFVEAVHSYPGQGVASTFAFGRSYGLLRGLLIGLRIPFEDVAPAKWVKGLGLQRHRKGRPETYSTRKILHKQWAQQWFPKLTITHATADAILLAEFGRRQMVVRSEEFARELVK